MKTTKIYKLIFLILFCSLIFACTSDKETEPSSNVEQVVISEPITKEPEVAKPVEIPSEDLEYTRSVSNLGGNISKATFEEDKAEILEIIEKLSAIMKHKDYASWLNYLTPESISFWSNQQNLALVSQRLPIKNYRLKNLQDYFEKVFIPSRIGRVVDEIRYESTTKVKAVQYTKEQDIIYYYFEKIDGRWFLHLDTTT